MAQIQALSERVKYFFNWNSILQNARYFVFNIYVYNLAFFLQCFISCKVHHSKDHHSVECIDAHDLGSASFPKVYLLKCGQFLFRFLHLTRLSLLADYRTLYLLGVSREKAGGDRSGEQGGQGTW
jgi:hypothetical protein